MTERLNLPIINPNAVFLKPKDKPAVRKNKFFKDEADFLSIERSLWSSEASEDQTERVEEINKNLDRR